MVSASPCQRRATLLKLKRKHDDLEQEKDNDNDNEDYYSCSSKDELESKQPRQTMPGLTNDASHVSSPQAVPLTSVATAPAAVAATAMNSNSVDDDEDDEDDEAAWYDSALVV